jgi:DNA-binding NarL/FixJ family response regulator
MAGGGPFRCHAPVAAAPRGEEVVTRILLADDHLAYRQHLRSLLEVEPGLQVVGEAGDGRTALRLAGELEPDIVLMDVAMPELGGIEATRQILAAHPRVRVIGLSLHSAPAFVRGMLAAGASAYRTKDGDFSELLRALRCAVEEGSRQRGEGV